MDRDSILFSDVKKLLRNFPSPVSPKGYRHFRNSFLDAVRVRLLNNRENDHPALNTNYLLLEMLKKQPPTYYLTEELIEAACNTSVPAISGHEIPFEYLNIFTPDGLCIVVNIMPICECHNTDDLPGQLQEAAGKRGVLVDTDGVELMITAVILADFQKDKGYAYTELNLFPSSCEDKDLIFCSVSTVGYARDYDDQILYRDKTVGQITRLIANAIMLINYQPSLITTQSSSSSGVGFSKKSSNEPMPVRWLGKTFSNDRTRSRSTGGHASPRSHWRRGHWHGYRCGEGRKVLKRKWIQPVYVNPQ